jgi:signal transduction histidine kinase
VLLARGCVWVARQRDEVSSPTEYAYRITAEALANAIRHAGATRIRVAQHAAGLRETSNVDGDGVGTTVTTCSPLAGHDDRVMSRL